MKQERPKGVRTWVEIDRRALKNNYAKFRKLTGPKCKLMAVVKSNAYGHGLVETSKIFSNLGADWLGVDSIVEGLRLRREGTTTPILVLGYTLPERLADAVTHKISLTISHREHLKNILRYPQIKFHLKVDTGMHRQGFLPEEMPVVLKKLKGRDIEGVYTHFASVKSAPGQLKIFNAVVTQIKKTGYSPIVHSSNSANTIFDHRTHLDMVRIGLGLYQNALTWKTIATEIKNLPTGSKIGYNHTATLRRPSTIAICPVGYWHGYPRSLSNVGQVMIQNKTAKIVGNVSMDMINIDVSHIKNVRIGTEVILLGQKINAERLATWAGTIDHEIITRLNPLMKKVYLN